MTSTYGLWQRLACEMQSTKWTEDISPLDVWLMPDLGEGRIESMASTRLVLWMAETALAALTTTGCATKNWVKTQTAPIVDHTGQLEDKTAANGRAIRDTDERAQSGIKGAQGSADSATQNAQNATKSAGDAEMAANDAVHRADSLDSVVKGLDNYKPLANVTVNFGFDKAM